MYPPVLPWVGQVNANGYQPPRNVGQARCPSPIRGGFVPGEGHCVGQKKQWWAWRDSEVCAEGHNCGGEGACGAGSLNLQQPQSCGAASRSHVKAEPEGGGVTGNVNIIGDVLCSELQHPGQWAYHCQRAEENHSPRGLSAQEGVQMCGKWQVEPVCAVRARQAQNP